MTDIQKKSDILGAVLTTAVWILFAILCFAVKMTPPHPDYKVIQIQLGDAVPVKQEEPAHLQPVQKEAPAEVKPAEKAPAETKPVAAAAKTAPVKATAPAAQQKTAPTPSTAVVTKSVEDLMAENNVPKEKQTTWDDSVFNDADGFVESTSTVATTATPSAKSASSFGGTAAASATTTATAKSAASSSASAQGDGPASSATTAALGKIVSTAPATYTGTSGNGVTSSATISSGSKNGHVAIQMAGGSARELLSPAKPVIAISAEHSALIDSTRRVTIKFTVLASGTVPLSTIEITPSSLLPLEIQNEIKAQISTWRFAA